MSHETQKFSGIFWLSRQSKFKLMWAFVHVLSSVYDAIKSFFCIFIDLKMVFKHEIGEISILNFVEQDRYNYNIGIITVSAF